MEAPGRRLNELISWCVIGLIFEQNDRQGVDGPLNKNREIVIDLSNYPSPPSMKRKRPRWQKRKLITGGGGWVGAPMEGGGVEVMCNLCSVWVKWATRLVRLFVVVYWLCPTQDCLALHVCTSLHQNVVRGNEKYSICIRYDLRECLSCVKAIAKCVMWRHNNNTEEEENHPQSRRLWHRSLVCRCHMSFVNQNWLFLFKSRNHFGVHISLGQPLKGSNITVFT